MCAFCEEHYRKNNVYLHQETTLMPNASTVLSDYAAREASTNIQYADWPVDN